MCGSLSRSLMDSYLLNPCHLTVGTSSFCGLSVRNAGRRSPSNVRMWLRYAFAYQKLRHATRQAHNFHLVAPVVRTCHAPHPLLLFTRPRARPRCTMSSDLRSNPNVAESMSTLTPLRWKEDKLANQELKLSCIRPKMY